MRSAKVSDIVSERKRELCGNFEHYVSLYDQEVPFRKSGQYEFHRATIDKRRTLGSVEAALSSPDFIRSVWETLAAWGMNSRAARLVPLEKFSRNLQKRIDILTELEPLQIDMPNGAAKQVAEKIWALIQSLEITTSQNALVSGSKAIHHFLPDLVPPIDRQYTRPFFQWYGPQFQYQPKAAFLDIYSHFVDIAEEVSPAQYVGEFWRTSKTKILDNATVAYCIENDIATS